MNRLKGLAAAFMLAALLALPFGASSNAVAADGVSVSVEFASGLPGGGYLTRTTADQMRPPGWVSRDVGFEVPSDRAQRTYFIWYWSGVQEAPQYLGRLIRNPDVKVRDNLNLVLGVGDPVNLGAFSWNPKQPGEVPPSFPAGEPRNEPPPLLKKQ